MFILNRLNITSLPKPFMKYIYLLLFHLLAATIAYAQPLPPTAIKTGIGITDYNRENENAPTLLLAFNKDFLPKTAIEVSLEWALPIDYQLDFESGKLQSLRIGLSFLYKAVDERNQLLHLGLGFSGGLYNRDYIEVFASGSIQEQRTDLTPGFAAIVEYHYVLPNDLFIGARGSAFRYDADRGGWSLGLVGGIRF